MKRWQKRSFLRRRRRSLLTIPFFRLANPIAARHSRSGMGPGNDARVRASSRIPVASFLPRRRQSIHPYLSTRGCRNAYSRSPSRRVLHKPRRSSKRPASSTRCSCCSPMPTNSLPPFFSFFPRLRSKPVPQKPFVAFVRLRLDWPPPSR